MVIYLTISVGVDAIHKLSDLILTQSEVIACKAGTQLIRTDLSTVILIEVGEGRSKMILLQIVVTMETGRNKFCVVDQAVLVGVDDVHGVEKLDICQVDGWDLSETFS